MNPLTNIEKRIKRHVIGKTQSFYVSTLPGMEQLCAKEFASAGIPTTDARLSNGGIEFSGRVHDGYLANLHLRTANRILMRLSSFRATNFRQLEKKLTGFPWELYLNSSAACEINVKGRHSRLFHSDAISNHFKKNMAERWRLLNSDSSEKKNFKQFSQQIFVRVADDRFTISIDSSGELLHKRGLKIQGGKAPIRETTAAAILALAGYKAGEALIDPMCGTGTFSIEGAMMANQIPAGWYRDFAFMGWPCFKPTRWKHIRREAKSRITRLTQPVIFASDKEQDNCHAFKDVIEKNDLSETISLCVKDFFDLLPKEMHGLSKTENLGLVVINPPYGRRLESKKDSDKLFSEICKKLKKDFTGWKIALIAPDKHLIKKVPFKVKTHPLFHGGLHLNLLTGRIR